MTLRSISDERERAASPAPPGRFSQWTSDPSIQSRGQGRGFDPICGAVRPGEIMNVLSVGRRRLNISIRFERVEPESGADLQESVRARDAREAALRERARWELDVLSQFGRIR